MKKVIQHIIIHVIILSCIFGCGSEKQQPSKASPHSFIDVIGRNESDIFPIAYNGYKSSIKELPIGVFDSGIGGLTVLAEIVRLDNFNNITRKSGSDGIPDFKNEHFTYLGDQANMPYGNYSSEHKTDFLRELIVKDAAFLLGRRYWVSQTAESPTFDKLPVKAIVIACNTATAFGIEHIRKALIQWKIPVYIIGVIDAGANGAVEALIESGANGTVAVMATVGTCTSEGYVRAVEKSAKDTDVSLPVVIQQGCLGLAGAIEGDTSYIKSAGNSTVDYQGPSIKNPNAPIDSSLIIQYSFENTGIVGNSNNVKSIQLNSVDNYIRYHTTTLVENYRKTGNTTPISTIILGCTHFPFHVGNIKAAYERLRNFADSDSSKPYGNLIAEHIRFIDPARFTAIQLYEELRDSKLLLDGSEKSAVFTDEFFISVPHSSTDKANLIESGAFTYDFKYGRNPGELSIEYVKRVPMSMRNLSPEVIKNITETMPLIRERLAEFNAESPRCTGIPDSYRITF